MQMHLRHVLQKRHRNLYNMDIIKNIDLLSVGLAIAATGVLGFLVLFSNKKSLTNRIFFYFSLITICWSVVNYLSYQSVGSSYGLLLLRLTIFFGLFHAFSFYKLFSVFPKEKHTSSFFHKFVLPPIVVSVAVLT